jgi:hypothetical protein
LERFSRHRDFDDLADNVDRVGFCVIAARHGGTAIKEDVVMAPLKRNDQLQTAFNHPNEINSASSQYEHRKRLKRPMSKVRFRNLAIGGLALSFTAILCAVFPATSAPTYDGLWSVVIVTEKGTCDRAYRYPIRIFNGTLANARNDAFVIAGTVGGNGAVTLMVSHGDKSATGLGRLSRAAGSGSWRGGNCAGTWNAERRSS